MLKPCVGVMCVTSSCGTRRTAGTALRRDESEPWRLPLLGACRRVCRSVPTPRRRLELWARRRRVRGKRGAARGLRLSTAAAAQDGRAVRAERHPSQLLQGGGLARVVQAQHENAELLAVLLEVAQE
eukprot:3055845-Prymnesium_polylepis.2